MVTSEYTPEANIPNQDNTAQGWASRYLDSDYTDPSGDDYHLSSDEATPSDDHKITSADPVVRQELFFLFHVCPESLHTVSWWGNLFNCNYINY